MKNKPNYILRKNYTKGGVWELISRRYSSKVETLIGVSTDIEGAKRLYMELVFNKIDENPFDFL